MLIFRPFFVYYLVRSDIKSREYHSFLSCLCTVTTSFTGMGCLILWDSPVLCPPQFIVEPLFTIKYSCLLQTFLSLVNYFFLLTSWPFKHSSAYSINLLYCSITWPSTLAWLWGAWHRVSMDLLFILSTQSKKGSVWNDNSIIPCNHEFLFSEFLQELLLASFIFTSVNSIKVIRNI